jgi:hypothetical protein
VNARQYRAALNKALKALAPLLAMLRAQGVPVTEAQRWEMAAQMVAPIRQSRNLAQQAALVYLASQGFPTVATVPKYDVVAVVDMLQRVVGKSQTRDQKPITSGNRRDTLVVEDVGARIVRAAERHAQQPAREIVEQVADEWPGVAWARVLTGARSCYFCAMLASRGPVYGSETSAQKGKNRVEYRGGQRVDRYHDGCDCEVVLVQNYSSWEGRRAHKLLAKLWEDSTEGTSGRRSMNAFRIAYEQQTGTGKFRPDSFTARAAA